MRVLKLGEVEVTFEDFDDIDEEGRGGRDGLVKEGVFLLFEEVLGRGSGGSHGGRVGRYDRISNDGVGVILSLGVVRRSGSRSGRDRTVLISLLAKDGDATVVVVHLAHLWWRASEVGAVLVGVTVETGRRGDFGDFGAGRRGRLDESVLEGGDVGEEGLRGRDGAKVGEFGDEGVDVLLEQD